MFAVNRGQQIVLWNAAATKILGYPSKEVLGRHCYGLMCGRDEQGCVICKKNCDTIRSAYRLRPPVTTDIQVRNKAGEAAWLNVSTILVPSRRDELSVLVHLFRDVTQEHEVLRAAENLAGLVSRNEPPKVAPNSGELPRGEKQVELTHREREILSAVASGASTAEIARGLRISQRTVRNHVQHILEKLEVHSRLEAVTYSIKNGLV